MAVFVAADVHYLSSGGARAAAVVAADPAFSRLAGDRTVVVADVAPYQPGQFYLRELPPLRAVLDGVSGLSLLVIDGYADLDRVRHADRVDGCTGGGRLLDGGRQTFTTVYL
jgi:deoxyribonuclease V